MLTGTHYPSCFSNVALPTTELLDIHYSKISLHRAKAGSATRRFGCLFYFSQLAGMPTRIYQTVHD
jgi:hypothetical protein